MKFFGGKLIAFSGIDGAGKSTQIQHLQKALKEQGQKSVYLWTRGGYTGPFNSIKALIRRLLGRRLPPPGRNQRRERIMNKKGVKAVWLSLSILDLILVYGIYIRALKFMGCVVIADRYLLDTQIDFRLNFPQENVAKWRLWKVLNFLAVKPEKYFILTISVKESQIRSKLKEEPFPDSKDTLESRLRDYLDFVSHNSYVTHIVGDSKTSIDSIHNRIIKELTK